MQQLFFILLSNNNHKKNKKISFKKTRNVFILLLIFTILLKECLGSEKKREKWRKWRKDGSLGSVAVAASVKSSRNRRRLCLQIGIPTRLLKIRRRALAWAWDSISNLRLGLQTTAFPGLSVCKPSLSFLLLN
jgi:hypothetical protein